MKKYKYDRVFAFEGKRYHVYADTLEEVGRKKAERLHQLKTKVRAAVDISINDWTVKCIETYKTGQAEITRRKYWNRVNRCILSYIGHYRVRDATPILCQEVLNHQRGNSRAQINEVYSALRFIFSHAVNNGIIDRDPTAMLKKPRGTYKPRRALTSFERDVLIRTASQDRRFYGFLLMLYCGCRPDEAFNAKREDVYLLNGMPVLHIKGTKTKNADREVPMPDILYDMVKSLRKTEYIAPYSTGKKITESNRARVWRALWRAMNIEAGTATYRNALVEPYKIPKDLTPYCLRHEFCSELARQKIDVRIAQRLMGHSTIALTANVYTHVETESMLTEVAAAMGRNKGRNIKQTKTTQKSARGNKRE